MSGSYVAWAVETYYMDISMFLNNTMRNIKWIVHIYKSYSAYFLDKNLVVYYFL